MKTFASNEKAPARETLPGNSIDLLAKLNTLFPPRCKFESETLEAHARYAGKVELVTYLNRLRDDAAASSPTDTLLR